MTFLASTDLPSTFRTYLGPAPRRPMVRRSRTTVGDEDNARRALGIDMQMPVAAYAGSSLEDLARIALG